MRMKIILNPTAGRGRALESQRIITDKLNAAGVEFDLETTLGPSQVVEQTQQAVSKSYDLIIAAGGDGTLNQVVNGMVGTGVPLGVLPCGTGNDFATMIGMPSQIDKCLDQIIAGGVSYVDLGKINERYFISSVGAGFDGQVAYTVNHGFPHLRGHIVYVLGIFKTIFSYPGHQINLTVDGKTENFKALLVAVNNSKTYGGGFMITPDAVLDDGYFSICTSQMMNPLEICLNLPKLSKGVHGRLKKIRLFEGKSITIESATPLYCQIDGEIEELSNLRFEILPHAFPIYGASFTPSASSLSEAASAGE